MNIDNVLEAELDDRLSEKSKYESSNVSASQM